MRRGFTLVELSIVLVIIGLLIGGILVAQSMISAAKITAQVRQFQQFDIATTNFRTKFGGLPGDTTVIPNAYSLIVGNNDGIIEDGPVGPNFFHNGNEFSNFWYQLTATGMLQDGHMYSDDIPCGPGACVIVGGLHIPLSAIDEKNLTILAFGIESAQKNYYGIMGNGWARTAPMAYASTSPGKLAALDSKMDDGIANTGKIVARVVFSTLTDPALAGAGSCYNASGIYLTATASATCLPRIEMLSQTGNGS